VRIHDKKFKKKYDRLLFYLFPGFTGNLAIGHIWQKRNYLNALLGLISCELPCEIRYSQEALLLQRGRATLRVVENFAYLLKVVRNDVVE